MRPMNIAHRGGAQLMPENTLAAFAGAVARGCDGVELDVQLSRDGVAVVHHDFRLMAGVARRNGVWLSCPGPRIRDLTLAELREFDVGHPQIGSDYALGHTMLHAVDDATVPALSEVVAVAKAAPRPFLLMVELKCDDCDDPVALADGAYEVLHAAGFLNGAIFVGFDWRALARIRMRQGCCWFSTERLHRDAHPEIDAIATAGGEGWFPNFIDATPSNVSYARALGLKVGAWTVNRQDDMRRLSDLNAICTDRPD